MNTKLPGYAEFGSKSDYPVFVFHGSPGSRLERPHDLSVCEKTGARLIVVERPGYGLTNFDGQRQLLDWPEQINNLANSLDIDNFSILGFSGGCAYALACGAKISGRINTIGLVGSVSPFSAAEVCENMLAGNRALFEQAADDYQQVALQLTQLIDSPDMLLQFFDNSVSEPDKLILARPQIRQMYRENLAEAIRQGFTGLAYDMALIASPWGFNVSDIDVEVQLWHGAKDLNAPIEMAQYLHRALPSCTAKFFTEAGHWIIFEHYQQILEGLVKPASFGSA